MTFYVKKNGSVILVKISQTTEPFLLYIWQIYITLTGKTAKAFGLKNLTDRSIIK